MTSTRLAATRPSDAERDQALEVLREGAGSGRLSHDTFVRRMTFVLRAQSRSELAHATRDLPRRESGLARIWSGFAARMPRLRRTPEVSVPQLPGLALPGTAAGPVRIGRGPGATLRLADDTVSRCHAELRHVDGGWVLADVGSMNGTHLNGLRITSPVSVRPGDHVRFGTVAYRLTWADPR
jgi:hypothetical protein